MGGIIFGKRKRRNQWGFTLIEIVIAMAISGLILVGTATLLYQIAVSSGDSTDRTQARLEIQYVSFWIGEDVIQASEVRIGSTSAINGFPYNPVLDGTHPFLVLKQQLPGKVIWTRYDVKDIKDKLGRDLWKLYRTEGIDGNNSVTIAENLDPFFTKCYRDGTQDVLVLELASKVDRMEASASFTLNPRSGDVTWGTWP